jgi:hypothetical protein
LANRNKCTGFRLRGNPQGVYLYGWLRGHYNHFTLLTAFHRAYLMVARVPSGQASASGVVSSFGPSGLPPSSSRCQLCDASVSMNSRGLRWDPILVVLLEIVRCEGSYVNQFMRRLTAPGGTREASICSFWHVPSPIKRGLFRMSTPGGLRLEACGLCPQ